MVGLALSSLALSACEQAVDETPSVGAFPDLVAFADGFSSVSDCAPLAQFYRPPTVGTIFEYRQANGARTSRLVEAVSGDLVTVRMRALQSSDGRVLPDTAPSFLRQTYAGVFAVSGAVGERRLTYEREPMAVLKSLGHGQTAEVAVNERIILNGRRVRAEVPVRIRYEACGHMDTLDGRDFVRVYQISSAGLDSRSGQGRRVLRTEATAYFSERHGFPVALQGAQTSMMVTAEAPAP